MTPDELRQSRLAELQAKLKAREGKPGFAANIEAIKRQISALESDAPFRHSETGQFVSVEFAIQNPETANG